jgi:prefoldin subunit 5
MSYSFNVRAADKAAARAAVAAEFDKVVEQQPIHEADRAQAEATVEAMLGVIPDAGEGEEVLVSVSGYVQWRGTLGGAAPVTITGANVSVGANVAAKLAAG